MATMEMIEAPTPQTYELDARDRCDACGSRAYIRATLHNGGQLLFCGHHGKKHAEAIAPSVASWLDETSQLK